MEIGEIIALPVPHGTANEKCPFCPPEEDPKYTTHSGAQNDSDVLGSVMQNPDRLVSRQPGARPKDGATDHQPKSDPRPYPERPYTDETHGHGVFSYQAHHLISGKQALEGHVFERWLVAGKTIEKDTGYSINNTDNGIWAPSIPEKYKKGLWGPKDEKDKMAITALAMAAGEPQVHIGEHAISDPADSGQIKHKTYDGYLKRTLKMMDGRMTGWARVCPGTANGEPFQPSVRVNAVMDNLSTVMLRKISPPASMWEVFLSAYALNYHYQIEGGGRCPHGVTRE